MRTSFAKIWSKFKLCLCTRPRGAWNKFCALFPASCVCNGPPKLRYWACQSASLWLCVAVAELRWFFWRARRWWDSMRHVHESNSITFAGPVSPRNLNAACLCVKVEPITILTESPALNWLCAVFASRRYNAIRCHRRDWRWEHARTGAAASRACVRGQGTQE